MAEALDITFKTQKQSLKVKILLSQAKGDHFKATKAIGQVFYLSFTLFISTE